MAAGQAQAAQGRVDTAAAARVHRRSGRIGQPGIRLHAGADEQVLRASPAPRAGGEQFAAAWDVALEHAARVLLDTAFDRAFNGSTEPVFDRDGNRTGIRYRQNDRLLMFLLRAYMPERFRHAHRDWRRADEDLPPAPPPMEEALRRLEPVTPAEPHTLLPPDELEVALECADILDGELPRWHRGNADLERGGPEPDAAFEERLERVKREGSARLRGAKNG